MPLAGKRRSVEGKARTDLPSTRSRTGRVPIAIGRAAFATLAVEFGQALSVDARQARVAVGRLVAAVAVRSPVLARVPEAQKTVWVPQDATLTIIAVLYGGIAGAVRTTSGAHNEGTPLPMMCQTQPSTHPGVSAGPVPKG